MKVYISTQLDNTYLTRKKLDEIQHKLELEGNVVVNPAQACKALPEDVTVEQQKNLRISLLQMCEGVMFLDGYEADSICNAELQYAIEHKYSIAFEGAKV